MSLALSTLIYEWRRYMAAVIALAVAGMLVLLMVGMFAGIATSFNAPIQHSPADIMVMNPNSNQLFGGGGGLPRRLLGQVYLHPAVAEVADLEGDGALWVNDPNGGQGNGGAGSGQSATAGKAKRAFTLVYAVDTRVGAVTLPTDFPPEARVAVEQPYAVAVDETSLAPLGVKIGDRASLNGHTVVVAATVRGYANVLNQMVFVSRQTARLLNLGNTGLRTGPLMVHLKDPAHAEQVRDDLNAHSQGLYRAWTRAELARSSQENLLKNNFIGIMLVGSVFIGLLVGVSITWQTLQGAILANIKEFASLRALGVSMGSLRLIVIELSFWVGVAGLLATSLMTWGMTQLAGLVNMPMAYPIPVIVIVAIMLMVIAMLSGVFSLGVLKKSQPADLLR